MGASAGLKKVAVNKSPARFPHDPLRLVRGGSAATPGRAACWDIDPRLVAPRAPQPPQIAQLIWSVGQHCRGVLLRTQPRAGRASSRPQQRRRQPREGTGTPEVGELLRASPSANSSQTRGVGGRCCWRWAPLLRTGLSPQTPKPSRLNPPRTRHFIWRRSLKTQARYLRPRLHACEYRLGAGTAIFSV